jgi:hypothetical protein
MTSEERKQARYERRKTTREQKRNEQVARYDSFTNLTNEDNLYQAFQSSRRGVAWKESVQRYEANLLRNIADTRRKLLDGKSVQNGFVEFDLSERGKIRHIKSVYISERIVQKTLCDQVLVPVLSRPLIYDNGASIKGKGLYFAVNRLITHLSRFYREHNSNDGYALIIDFKKFFDNIDHAVLFDLLKKEIWDEKILELTKRFVSVFGDGKSLGLGSQVSQIAAIFYPNKLDHYIKEVLRIKYYGRYMDDLYLIHKDKEYLKQCLDKIQEVCLSLKITIHLKKTKIVPLRKGILFLKGRYYLLENGKVLRRPCKESALRMRRKLRKFKVLLDEGKMSYDDIRNAYQSWRGSFMKRFNAYHLLKRMDDFYNELFT